MLVIETIADLRKWTRENSRVKRVLVPTMGALHEGHLSLCDRAREEAGKDGHVVASIFVNPTQFGPDEDFGAYPRTLKEDLDVCRARGVDVVFAPERKEVFAEDASVTVKESQLSRGLCGKSRPVHFGGVCTVVAKLFLLVQPDAAVFGQKDYQQLMIIHRMVRDLNFPVKIVGGPTVREKDGLAMSSRNAYLTPEQREEAPIVFRSICELRDLIEAGEIPTPEDGKRKLEKLLGKSEQGKIDYLEIVHPTTLEPLTAFDDSGFRIVVAMYFGKTRLIDNLG